MPELSAETLATLSDAVAVPTYDRSAVTIGIVHFGVGGFHRAHQAMYVDRLMNQGGALDWGICGVGLLPGDRTMQSALGAQDHLYTLVTKHPDGELSARVIGSIVDYLYAPDDPERVLERLTAPTTRIVSLTVTEGGYHLHPATGEFESDEQIERDLQPGATPTSLFAILTEALVRRRTRGIEPFTVVSCDNIEENGDVARRALGGFATLRDPELGAWVRSAVSFPSSMVDRITPTTSDDDRSQLAERFGVVDRWPVVCEPFAQWVVADRFPAGRPRLEDADVQVVDDVRPYELMKLRLLNGGHQALGFLGYLGGYRYVHEVSRDPLFAAFVSDYLVREASPTLPPVPGMDLAAYRQTLFERFANPFVGDTLTRICAYSSDRMPKFVLPVIREQLAAGGSGDVARSALIVAAWARYAEGVDESGDPIEVVDARSERLSSAARRSGQDPTAFIRDRDIFGDLADDERFVAPYVAALASLHARGARSTLESLQADGRVPPA